MEDELAQARRRPGRGGRGGRAAPCAATAPACATRKRPIGSFIFLGPDRRRQDRAGPRAGRVPVRRRGRADPHRHVGVHGEVLRLAPGRRAPGLRRLRGGRPAHREGAAQALLGGPARRDREGAPGRVQHPAAGARGRAAHRQLRPQGGLQEHGHHHDLEPRRAADHAAASTWASAAPTRSDQQLRSR